MNDLLLNLVTFLVYSAQTAAAVTFFFASNLFAVKAALALHMMLRICSAVSV